MAVKNPKKKKNGTERNVIKGNKKTHFNIR